MYGTANSGTGIWGASTSGTGVYGSTLAANSITNAGVWGVGAGSGSIGVHGQANVANAVGVFGQSSSATGFGVYARNNNGGRALYVDGPAGQSPGFGGMLKALVRVNGSGWIDRCYNAVTGNSTVPCGFSLTSPRNR